MENRTDCQKQIGCRCAKWAHPVFIPDIFGEFYCPKNKNIFGIQLIWCSLDVHYTVNGRPEKSVVHGKLCLRDCFGRPFVKRFAICYWTLSVPFCLPWLSVCGVGVLSPNGWLDQDATWYAGRPRPRPHCVRWEPTPYPKKGTAPIFGPCLLWSNGRND